MKLKVCGMKYTENIIEVAALKPDYLGFIFYKKSPRFFNKKSLPKMDSSIKKIGVFVDEEIENIIKKIETFDLQGIQLHGNESPQYIEKIKEYISKQKHNHIEIINVFSIKDEFNFKVLNDYESICDYYLFDTKGEKPGGNGYTFNWNILNKNPSSKPFFLSGGIGLNEIHAIKEFQNTDISKHCHAIDINSKFEIDHGLKNVSSLKMFKQRLYDL